ncbi:MAG: GNAT family N-acetyltransferase [Oculatellaceae cyanobacterium bins.114]|nr:GNAT family N-acetyltransferase [Oculatellaceae cyanobacterium bins.114]
MELLPGYELRLGSGLDRPLLLKFMQRTYRESHPDQPVAHLAQTVEQYLSKETPIWWVETAERQPVACLWMGSAIDQLSGDRQSYIFLLYVTPDHRRRGIGKALMHHAETWVRTKGHHQIGLQVFQANQAALNLYRQFGYEVQSLWMVKRLAD